MKKLIFPLFFFLFISYPLSLSAQDEFYETIRNEFQGIKKQYDTFKTFPVRMKILTEFFTEIAKIFYEKTKENSTISSFYDQGIAEAFIDTTLFLNFFEDKIYEGQLIKVFGHGLQKTIPSLRQAILQISRQKQYSYFNLEDWDKKKFLDTFFESLLILIRQNLDKMEKSSDETLLFLSGYMGGLSFYIGFNRFFDNQIQLDALTEIFVQLARPQEKKSK
ncbi:MAG TPA: hypothetical protein DHW82_01260 [Spirochaetia bacterium]|nr:MAG: hypothetical protein A2Y41_04720 [Spirochaetes bacterium GWB1_36_13]HCL55625.1 hypothetical protein [Spirochaetia bacterium]